MTQRQPVSRQAIGDPPRALCGGTRAAARHGARRQSGGKTEACRLPPAACVAYLLKRFPRLSETFILHEILELERQGLDLRLFALMNPSEKIVHADVARVRAPVTYLPAGWQGTLAMVRAHLALVRRSPRRYVGVGPGPRRMVWGRDS